ncbi:unnamed protein product, partial [Penicillium discolor]
ASWILPALAGGRFDRVPLATFGLADLTDLLADAEDVACLEVLVGALDDPPDLVDVVAQDAGTAVTDRQRVRRNTTRPAIRARGAARARRARRHPRRRGARSSDLEEPDPRREEPAEEGLGQGAPIPLRGGGRAPRGCDARPHLRHAHPRPRLLRASMERGDRRVSDINILGRRVHVNRAAVEAHGVIEIGAPKSWEKRTVPFPGFVVDALEGQCGGKSKGDLVFGDASGNFLRRAKTSEGAGPCLHARLRKPACSGSRRKTSGTRRRRSPSARARW